MNQTINYKFWTVCMIQDNDKVLLLDRQHDYFKGFIPPGGKVDFPESFVESAIREVKEETGLEVSNLIFKGIYEYVNPEKNDRYIIFNYLTKEFKGDLLNESPEGIPIWVPIKEMDSLPIQKSIRRRIPLFFKEGTFEIQVTWDNEKNDEGEVVIRET
ncbi:8-oxo-dGTP diphosphatase [Psychrobacillus sp. PGGUH221]|uniref:8-oxo-dGTP diphosphatase n=1 Tax=Psychrobacillus sp. PGGUH221 TaxID=3020058 RepID=UPI0035C6C929